MNKNVSKLISFILLLMFVPNLVGMQPKVPLENAFAASAQTQEKFNKFWFNLYDFERDRLSELLAVKKNSTNKKLALFPEDTTSTPAEILRKKIKQGIWYSLPTLSSASLSVLGLYCAHKSLTDDSNGLKNLFYSSAVCFTAGYYCLQYTLPSLKKGISSFYKCTAYKKYLENKKTMIEEFSKKINTA